ncbi:hypothetical protein QQP08_006283 [Theobroma cacao]|nr:hypothetical protein QQP08_006283 [Theobroma cacao]
MEKILFGVSFSYSKKMERMWLTWPLPQEFAPSVLSILEFVCVEFLLALVSNQFGQNFDGQSCLQLKILIT